MRIRRKKSAKKDGRSFCSAVEWAGDVWTGVLIGALSGPAGPKGTLGLRACLGNPIFLVAAEVTRLKLPGKRRPFAEMRASLPRLLSNNPPRRRSRFSIGGVGLIEL